MNEQNAADKDLLTIEELAAHAMECEKEEAEASASLEDVAAEETPEDEVSNEMEETEETNADEAKKTKGKPSKKAAKASGEEKEKRGSLSQQLRDFVDEDELKPFKLGPLFKALIGGDGLNSIIARNWLFITVLVFFSCCYVTSRYMMQNATLERNTLTRTLADRKYKALTASSEYLEKTRSHYIESNLKDTTIHSSTDMPYALKIDNNHSNE